MKFNLTIEVEVNEMRFLEALENPEFYAFTTDMETIEDTIKQTVASDISFNNNVHGGLFFMVNFCKNNFSINSFSPIVSTHFKPSFPYDTLPPLIVSNPK